MQSHLASVGQSFHGSAAQLEANRTFQTSVSEIQVAEFGLKHPSVTLKGKAYILELQTFKGFSPFAGGSAAVYVAFQTCIYAFFVWRRGINRFSRGDFVAFRDYSCERRETLGDFMPQPGSPDVTVSGGP